MDDGDNYTILKTWEAEVDATGRLVQEIESPRVRERGTYGIAVFGEELSEVSFAATERFYASAATTFYVLAAAESLPQVVQVTITPRPIKQTLTPAGFNCFKAPEPRVDIDDSIRVTYTDGTPLRLRSAPEVSNNNIIELIPEGGRMKVLDGPVCEPRPGRNDAFIYWKVRVTSSGLQGWVAEGDLYNYYIEKYP